jgi:hypothetical protein
VIDRLETREPHAIGRSIAKTRIES